MILLELALASASAQDPTPPPAPEPPPPEEGSPGPTPEELAAIEAALAADAEAQKASAPPPPAPSGGVGRTIQSMNPDLSVILDVAGAAFSADAPLQGGGHDPTLDGFNLQQLELSLGAPIDPYLRFDSNLVFSLFGVEIEEAYATTLALPLRAQIRAGQFLTRFGRINPTHLHSWQFVDQPFAVGRLFGAEGNRGLGVEGSVLLPLPWYVELVGSTTMSGGEATNRSWTLGTDDPIRSPADLHAVGAIKQFFPLSSDWSLALGLSFAGAPNGTGRGNRSEVYGADLYLRYRPITVGSYSFVSLESEWFHRRRQIPSDVLSDLSSYTQLVWKFSRRWGVGGRWEYGTPARDLEGQVASDPLDPEWTLDRQRIAADLTFWPSHFSRLRLQGASDRPGWIEEAGLSAFLQLEVLAGAHGAHNF